MHFDRAVSHPEINLYLGLLRREDQTKRRGPQPSGAQSLTGYNVRLHRRPMAYAGNTNPYGGLYAVRLRLVRLVGAGPNDAGRARARARSTLTSPS